MPLKVHIRLVIGVLASLVACTCSAELKSISLHVNDLIYDANNDELLVSVPGIERWRGNTITRIKPSTMEILGSVFVGSEPDRMAISDSGQTVYVCLDGAAKIARYDVTNRQLVQTFVVSLTTHFFSGFYFANDVDVQPGSESTIAAIANPFSWPDKFAGIYDSGVRRQNILVGESVDTVQFVGPSILYCAVNSNSGYELFKTQVGPTGLSVLQVLGNVTVFNKYLLYSGGRFYSNARQVIAADPFGLAGTFEKIGPTAIDESAGIIYRPANGTTQALIWLYDIKTLSLLGTVDAGYTGRPEAAVLCGPGRVAFTTDDDKLNVYTFQ